MRIGHEDLEDDLKNIRKVYGEGHVQICEEMGDEYQQQAPDRLLLRTHNSCHNLMRFNYPQDVSPLVPTITEELLTGAFGTPYNVYYHITPESDQEGGMSKEEGKTQ